MNTALLILAVLSVGAVVIATYVFMVAARNYVSDSTENEQIPGRNETGKREFVERSSADRRQNNVIDFPITLTSGDVIYRERRVAERRSA